MGRLFGTDGARGIANTELTPELAMNIGRAAAMVLVNKQTKHPKVLIGKDTRLSSDMLEGALTAGLCSVGANVIKLGVVPTPAVAYLVGKYEADAGIMISASHNPFEFNGIKIFNRDGFKLPDKLEEEIESIVLENSQPYPKLSGAMLGCVTDANTAVDDYTTHVISTVDYTLDGMEIALDCSNGSSSRTAEKLFTTLGAKCHMLFDKPNGVNINDNCGSTHMENLMNYVKQHKLDCGMAFDGDADRCLAVDENGDLVDGDFIIAICAQDMKNRNILDNNAVVGTILTNMGFNKFCDNEGIKFVGTKVGDRYVLETMRAEGYNLGGEQSGHVIFLDYSTTGDGQMTAAQLLSMMNRRKEKLSTMAKLMTRMPQVMINVNVTNEGKLRLDSDEVIQNELSKAAQKLGDRGRILVRPSGTEPLIRVMTEGSDKDEISTIAESIAQIIEDRLS